MEISPAGIVFSIIALFIIAWFISIPLVLLLHKLKVIKVTGCLDCGVFSFLLAIVLSVLYFCIRIFIIKH
jgi:hypothetical protein